MCLGKVKRHSRSGRRVHPRSAILSVCGIFCALGDRAAKAVKARYESYGCSGVIAIDRKYEDLVVMPLPMCTNHFVGDDGWFYRRLFALGLGVGRAFCHTEDFV